MPPTPPNANHETDDPSDRSPPNAGGRNPGAGSGTGTAPVPELPELSPGITLLSADDPGPLRSLVVDHLLGADGPAVWVDAGAVARTPPLLQLAPSRRTLDRIRVARGFTAFQHRALLDRLREVVSDRTALAVVPRIDRPYRADDPGDEEGTRMLVDGIAALAAAVREHDLPALVTRHAADPTSAPVANAADRRIAVEETRFGPRFVGDDVETLVYPGEGYVQTTLAFWRRVLATRHGIDPGIAAPGDREGRAPALSTGSARVGERRGPTVGGGVLAAEGTRW